jgi:hypothetical protein
VYLDPSVAHRFVCPLLLSDVKNIGQDGAMMMVITGIGRRRESLSGRLSIS